MALSLRRPSRERSEMRAKAAAEKLGGGEKRIVADVPEHIPSAGAREVPSAGRARAGLHPRAAREGRGQVTSRRARTGL